ncbi:hypothetical protein Bcav_0259 [Beutenbergia cavernae DSM 12333]|uniref:Lipoprotein n=1 Tax=Beutenbergia cavernae (strain ATCC BAA-8 / DSM 12333 / CCUG 43141 / JCM 11478 / NBRC 16432 / NCIMB 13614 / HKI 0122) TaxID=471853 RepID=C5BVT4_BEUC1|nr:hypothetical protein [Beutenbergia cavernae]ACQ78524.1 hypothetical protein Bcav_0259 [Beutenbergia cavernae DSM 12333]
MTRRPAARAARIGAAMTTAALAVVGLPACSLIAPGDPIGPVTVCGTEPAPGAGDPGDAEILLRAGFLIPGGPPRYVVYTDGAVFLVGLPEADADAAAVDAPDGAVAAAAPALAVAPVPQSDLDEGAYAGALPRCALDQLEEYGDELAGLVERLGGELGAPTITDQGTSELEYRPPDGEPVVASAYALGEEHGTEGVDREQRRARELMVALAEVVHVNATALGAVRVDHVEVHAYADDADQVDWPLETPLAEIVEIGDCGELTGADAAALVEAEGADHDFTPNGGYVSINVLAPGESACT